MLSQQSPLFPSSLSTLESEQKIESFDAMDGFRMKTGSSTLDGMEAGMSNNESRFVANMCVQTLQCVIVGLLGLQCVFRPQ